MHNLAKSLQNLHCWLQILLQVQAMSAVPQQEKYKGLVDALKRIPQREGFLVRLTTAQLACQKHPVAVLLVVEVTPVQSAQIA